MEIFLLTVVVAVSVLALCSVVRLIVALFSAEVRRRIRAHPILHALWWVLTVAWLVLLFWPSIWTPPHPHLPRRTMVKLDVVSLRTALCAYEVEYGRYPLQKSKTEDYLYDSDYVSLVAVLQGTAVLKHENPRGIEFYDFTPRDLDKQGRYLDPWATLTISLPTGIAMAKSLWVAWLSATPWRSGRMARTARTSSAKATTSVRGSKPHVPVCRPRPRRLASLGLFRMYCV